MFRIDYKRSRIENHRSVIYCKKSVFSRARRTTKTNRARFQMKIKLKSLYAFVWIIRDYGMPVDLQRFDIFFDFEFNLLLVNFNCSYCC